MGVGVGTNRHICQLIERVLRYCLYTWSVGLPMLMRSPTQPKCQTGSECKRVRVVVGTVTGVRLWIT